LASEPDHDAVVLGYLGCQFGQIGVARYPRHTVAGP